MSPKPRAILFTLPLALAASSLIGCADTVTSVHRDGNIRPKAKWAMLPVQNHSETPQAGERVEAILDTLLRKGGISLLDTYPTSKEDETRLITSDRQKYESALEWARARGYDYAVTGSVEEWRYKSGLDGEPAVGVSMRVLDVGSGKVLWAATGTKTGAPSENTSATAMKLLSAMVKQLGERP